MSGSATPSSDAQYVLLLDSDTVVAAEGTLFLRRNGRSLRIDDEQITGLWRRCRHAFDGSTDLRRLAADGHVGILELADLLCSAALAWRVPGSEQWAAPQLPPLVEQHPEILRPLLGRRAVWLFGSPTWSGDLLGRLSMAGIAVRSLPSLNALEQDRTGEVGPDLVVSGFGPHELADQMALAIHAQGERWSVLHAIAGIAEHQIGPLVVPGETACWNCLRVRLLGHRADRAIEAALQSALLASTVVAGRPPLPADQMLVGVLLTRVLRLLLQPHEENDLRVAYLATDGSAATTHGVTPLPVCEVCGGARNRRSRAPSDGQAARQEEPPWHEQLSSWVDPRSGVFRSIEIRMHEAGERLHLPWCAEVTVAALADERGEHFGAFQAWGKGFTAEEAKIRALGEAAERYSASRVDVDALRTARLDELDGDRLDPRSLTSYTDAQYRRRDFPFRPFDPSSPCRWVRGRWANTDTAVWVPAFAVFSQMNGPPENFGQVTSSGMAAGRGLQDAARRAALELAERHIFLDVWAYRKPGRRLATDHLDEADEDILHHLRLLGASVEFYALPSELGVPVVACLAFGDGVDWPAVSVVTAAGADFHAAMRDALLEQGLAGPPLSRAIRRGDAQAVMKPEQVRTFRDHALFFSHRANVGRFDALRSGSLEAPDAAGLEEATDVWAALARSGHRVAVVDITAHDVALTELRVARAICPSLQPLHCGYDMQPSQSGAGSPMRTDPLAWLHPLP